MRLRHLTGAESELGKFEDELQRYNTWLDTAEDSLRGLQRSVGDLAKLSQQQQQHKVGHSYTIDVNACQSSLRTVSAVKLTLERKAPGVKDKS